MKKKAVLIGLCISLALTGTACQVKESNLGNQVESLKTNEVSGDKVGNMSIARIKQILQKIKDIDDADNGKMWGIPLATRIMVVDSDTRKVITTEADTKGNFKKIDNNLYEGQLPDDIGLANSTIEYGEKQWAMVIYTESDDESDTLVTYVHEMFHNVQKELGQDGDSTSAEDGSGYYDNSHMDEMDARIYLKLEWEALHKGLESSGKEKKKAIADALTFRLARRSEYNSAKDENIHEIQEGMAEYTGNKLVYSTDDLMNRILHSHWKRFLNEKITNTLVRSFGYHSGVLYGLLLDECSSKWRRSIEYDSDLGEILREQYAINLSDLSLKESEKRYNYEGIYQYEYKRNKEREKITSKYTEKFINGAILQLNLNHPQIVFNPNNIWALKGHGSVYVTAEIKDDFGKIDVKKGGLLLSSDWNKAVVSSENIQISGSNITGDGWILKLKAGYTLKEKKNGCYIIEKK
ncbi:hypothetical protein [Marinisporobacter balticus]|uniref:Uncharacterized protein n=1 Tax=Marinisporobacter balticus TaxID=2018667 RepID=A0A4R2KY06_9FIRM|nr:hypothetical protein [Marinisporobacter balticus]TCO77972.1 hypothetical protein EV214_10568 [Marinisporobacter balticus]